MSQNEPNTGVMQDAQDNTEEINTSPQDNTNDVNLNKELYKVSKEKWDEYYEKYKDMIVQNRDYSTHISGQIADGQWEVIDLAVDRNLKSINETREITVWDINVCLYVSAITLPEFNGLLEQKNIKRKEKPGWLIQAETKIEAIRKHLSRIDVVLKCK